MHNAIMSFSRSLPILAFALFISGCATPPPINTPTGRPEVTIASSDTNAIKSRLISVSAGFGYSLVSDTQYSLVFQKPMEGWGGALYQAAMGNAYSSQPQLIVRYTITTTGRSTHIFASVGTNMQNAFGRSEGIDLSRGKAGGELQAVLERLKAEMEHR